MDNPILKAGTNPSGSDYGPGYQKRKKIMDTYNIYLTGVGGQGIGLLSEILVRAADHAGMTVKSVDTHGLAQRGGIVVSQLRLGKGCHSPLIAKGRADYVIAMERHEALRGVNHAIKDGGTLLYYNTVWQPLPVRLNQAEMVTETQISEACRARSVKEIVISKPDLEDSRMQNIVILAAVYRNSLLPSIEEEHYLLAMSDLLSGDVLEKNTHLFKEEIA